MFSQGCFAELDISRNNISDNLIPRTRERTMANCHVWYNYQRMAMSIRALLLDFTWESCTFQFILSVVCMSTTASHWPKRLPWSRQVWTWPFHHLWVFQAQSPVTVSSWPCNMSLYHVHHGMYSLVGWDWCNVKLMDRIAKIPMFMLKTTWSLTSYRNLFIVWQFWRESL